MTQEEKNAGQVVLEEILQILKKHNACLSVSENWGESSTGYISFYDEDEDNSSYKSSYIFKLNGNVIHHVDEYKVKPLDIE